MEQWRDSGSSLSYHTLVLNQLFNNLGEIPSSMEVGKNFILLKWVTLCSLIDGLGLYSFISDKE